MKKRYALLIYSLLKCLLGDMYNDEYKHPFARKKLSLIIAKIE